jgi:biopolymer transport protein ExbD
MIDVVFLLITFFMVVSEFTRQDDIEELRLPPVTQVSPEGPLSAPPIVVNVTRDGTIYVSGEEVTVEELRTRLLASLRVASQDGEDGSPPLRVRADERTPFHHVRSILAVCTEARIGIWKVSFGAREPERAGTRRRRHAP